MTSVRINGNKVLVTEGTSVASAVLNHNSAATRLSVSGTPRGPLCGMGICFECRLTVDGQMHVRSCQLVCREGMEIDTCG